MIERQGTRHMSGTPAVVNRRSAIGNRKWIWFFVLLGTLAAAGVATEIWFNLHQQLTPEKLASAHARWRENGPRDYALEYAVKREYNPEPAPRTGDNYTVLVKGGKVESVTG